MSGLKKTNKQTVVVPPPGSILKQYVGEQWCCLLFQQVRTRGRRCHAVHRTMRHSEKLPHHPYISNSLDNIGRPYENT